MVNLFSGYGECIVPVVVSQQKEEKKNVFEYETCLRFADLKQKVVEIIKDLYDKGTREFTAEDIGHCLTLKGYQFNPKYLSQILSTHIIGIRSAFSKPTGAYGRSPNIYFVEVGPSCVSATRYYS